MSSNRSARIAGIEFQGWPSDHHDEWFIIGPDGLKSFWGGVDVRREEIARPSAHGSYDLPGYLSPRVIPITGYMSARTPEGLERMQARLSGLLADGSSSRLTVEDESRSRWCNVRLASATQITPMDKTTASFLVTFWAADPRTYGDVRDYAAGVLAINRGNFPASPRLMVGAGSGGYTITGPTGRTIVSASPPAAAHYIDFTAGGMFTSAGARVVGGMTTFRDWVIPSGIPSVSASITGSRTLAQRVTDTFI